MSRQCGRLGQRLAVEVANIGHVRVELADRQPIGRVWRVAVAELQRRRLRLDPVPDHIPRQPRTVRPIGRDVLARARQPRVEVVLLRPRIGTEDVAKRWRGPAAVLAAGLTAVVEHLQILIVPPDEPLVDSLGFDPRAVRRAADEPQAVAHAVEPGVVARHVFPIDRRACLENPIDGRHQARHRVLPFGLRHVVVEPVPCHDRVNAARRIPVDRLLLLEALVVEPQAGIETLLRQVQVSRVLRHQEDEGRPRRFRPQLTCRGTFHVLKIVRQAVDSALDRLVPARSLHGGPDRVRPATCRR